VWFCRHLFSHTPFYNKKRDLLLAGGRARRGSVGGSSVPPSEDPLVKSWGALI